MSEAVWRLLGFSMYDGYPPITRLIVHLEEQGTVHCDDPGLDVEQVADSSEHKDSTLTA